MGIDIPVVEGIVVLGLPIERAIRLRRPGNGGIRSQADRLDDGVGGRINDRDGHALLVRHIGRVGKPLGGPEGECSCDKTNQGDCSRIP